jgi:hypothetical protein
LSAIGREMVDRIAKARQAEEEEQIFPGRNSV